MPKNSKSNILVVGSIAFDLIFDLTSAIHEQLHFKDGKPGKQNLMFVAKKKRQFRGGTAGNIAYGLSLLGERPLMFSAAGKDFVEYEKDLEKRGVETRVFKDKEGWTAVYYGMADTLGEQVGVWQPNAYYDHIERLSLSSTMTSSELKNVSLAIFSPGTPKSTIKHIKELKAVNKTARIIFDPGQTLAALYTKKTFYEALRFSHILILNEGEMAYAVKRLDFDLKEALKKGKIIIETKGEDGSIIFEGGEKRVIPSVKPRKINDVTGAGDAFRAGFLFGLHNNYSLKKSAEIASFVGAKCIECVGGQEYVVSQKNKWRK